ncbi:MAG: hypothetical protein LIP01_00285 [Tannerellaceae bacterium]|nr:hypothetical protein [Tannerellaceae bacterium]
MDKFIRTFFMNWLGQMQYNQRGFNVLNTSDIKKETVKTEDGKQTEDYIFSLMEKVSLFNGRNLTGKESSFFGKKHLISLTICWP